MSAGDAEDLPECATATTIGVVLRTRRGGRCTTTTLLGVVRVQASIRTEMSRWADTLRSELRPTSASLSNSERLAIERAKVCSALQERSSTPTSPGREETTGDECDSVWCGGMIVLTTELPSNDPMPGGLQNAELREKLVYNQVLRTQQQESSRDVNQHLVSTSQAAVAGAAARFRALIPRPMTPMTSHDSGVWCPCHLAAFGDALCPGS